MKKLMKNRGAEFAMSVLKVISESIDSKDLKDRDDIENYFSYILQGLKDLIEAY